MRSLAFACAVVIAGCATPPAEKPKKLPGPSLVVVDEDGRPLKGASVYSVEGGFRPGLWLPGPETLEREAGRTDDAGRFALGQVREPLPLCVGAEGYGWKGIWVDPAAGDHVVALEPGGDLVLHVEGWSRVEEPCIWGRRLCTSDTFRVPPPGDDDRVLVSGLPADQYEFTVRRGSEGHIHARVEVRVRAGQRLEAILPVSTEALRPRVTVTGTIVVPEAWKTEPIWIEFRGEEDGNRDVHEMVQFSRRMRSPVPFATAPIPSGRYLVKIPGMLEERVDVAEGSSRFEFEVPPPVDLRVLVRNAETGAPLPDAEAGTGGAGPDVPPGEDRRIQVPLGAAVEIRARAPGFLDGHAVVEARERDCQVIVDLRTAGTIVVRFASDDGFFAPADARVELASEESSVEYSFSGGSHDVEPGHWTVYPPDVAGYLPAEPQEVDVKAGQTVEVVFRLRRK